MTHRRAVAGAVLITGSACVMAWALAYPATSLAPALTRAVADGAAVVTVGLAAVPVLDAGRYREEFIRRASAPLVAASAVWLVAELIRLVLAGAEAAGTGVHGLGMHTAVEFALRTAPGRAGLITMAAALAVCVVAALAPRSDSARIVATALGGIGIVGHPLTGHLSMNPWGGVAIAVHALAAALWCGILAALVLTVEHRGQWARVLPRFSQLSLVCVAVLLVAGIVGATVVVSTPADLYATGYGRVLSAKLVLTAALTVLAWRNRTGWLPAARAHRATATVSRSRAYTELALMAAALSAAATLAVTG
ncbi:copper resistance protein D [Mycolicibacterium cyprinidarum]|uniref:Copper resistance protein D n=1 Tax=Mycolicibacterium cyprinidarum TaxID=2860311 RepID=A0ABQ4V5H6_9MYCO|nr:copper resistance protein D [Mycolicibacterium sp. NGTWSNA01]GJF13358.1 copper resistance protein D [Mycolicibacterium sp. NGTWS0302]GJF16366.1 copper resistance protein D [Mycolicibacterium sp. NGTWS1803]